LLIAVNKRDEFLWANEQFAGASHLVKRDSAQARLGFRFARFTFRGGAMHFLRGMMDKETR